ncbi:MAG: Uma2 family endonuclease [Actinomycetes bacterium]
MATIEVPPDHWTVDTMPDAEDVGLELVDGALLVTPPERIGNSVVASRLVAVLARAAGSERDVIAHGGVYFDQHNYREPDVVVCRRLPRGAARLDARDVELAVEVLSPSSLLNDRVAKPAQYAAAGIPHYWLLDPDAPSLVAHELHDGGYRVAARFDDVVAVQRPVAVTFSLDELLA